MAKPHYKPMTIPDGYHKGITGWVVTHEVRYLHRSKRHGLRLVEVRLRGRGYTPSHATFNLSRAFGYMKAVEHDRGQRIKGVPVRWQPKTPDEIEHARRRK